MDYNYDRNGGKQMTELERLEQLEKKLKVRKRKVLAKEYEKLGREFYKKSNAKSLSEAAEILTNMPLSSNQNQFSTTLTEKQFSQLQAIADSMKWTGNYWQIDNLKEVSQLLSQFRKESQKKV